MSFRSALLAQLLVCAAVLPTSSEAQVFPAFQPFATYPPGGGPISIHSPTDFDFHGLDFQSASGSLIPVESGDAAPFTFFLSNTPNQVTFGNLDTPVTFPAGITELSVGAEGGALDILWGQDFVRELLPGPVASFPRGGGPISIFTSSEIHFAGLDFQSPEGNLIPVDDAEGAAPFTFFLSNTPTQVTYGNLGSVVTLAAGSTIEMSVAARSGAEDITWFFGGGPGVISAPLFDTDISVREQIPEPATSWPLSMATIVFVSLLRKQRNSHQTRPHWQVDRPTE